MNNKKGISAVVATVLIILITVAAVTIIWAAIIPMIKTQLQEGTACVGANSALLVENKGFTCIDGANVNVQVSHGSSDVGLSDIQILIADASGNTVSYVWSNATVTGDLPGINGQSVLVVTGAGAASQSVSVAPIITVDNDVITCDETVPVVLAVCPP